MSAYNFFSNNVVFVDGEQCEITKSLANTRYDVQRVFETPSHTVDTPNLFVFLDGNLQTKDIDYNDSNSTQITFTKDIPINKTVICMMIKINKSIPDSIEKSILWDTF